MSAFEPSWGSMIGVVDFRIGPNALKARPSTQGAEGRLRRVRPGVWHIGSKGAFDAGTRYLAVVLALAVKPSQETCGFSDLGSLDEKVALKNLANELPFVPLGRVTRGHSEFA